LQRGGGEHRGAVGNPRQALGRALDVIDPDGEAGCDQAALLVLSASCIRRPTGTAVRCSSCSPSSSLASSGSSALALATLNSPTSPGRSDPSASSASCRRTAPCTSLPPAPLATSHCPMLGPL